MTQYALSAGHLAHEAVEELREDERIDKAEHAMVARYQGRGGGSPDAVRAALGNYAEIHKHDVDAPEKGESDSQTGALNLKRDYVAYDRADPEKDARPVGDLDNPAQRLVVLEHLTQTGEDKNATDLAECGPSSLIGGALLAGGTDGLSKIMDATLAHCSDGNREELAAQMDDIRKAMKEGKLNFGHLQELQKDLYTVMQRDMEGEDPEVMKKAVEDKGDSAKGDAAAHTGGIKGDTLEQFLATSPKLKEMFAKQGLAVSHIDSDGERDGYGRDDAEHFVLSMKDKQGKLDGVYDPWERRHGQVVTNATELRSYEQAEHRSITGAE